MLSALIAALTKFIIGVISAGGYSGIAFLMAIESAAIPLPSEIIMPFSGYLVAQGQFTLIGISLAGAIGSVIGSMALYFIGFFGGRPLVEKYGKYILISQRDLRGAENFFSKYGDLANFFGRMLPVVRTFISFPAGIAKTNLRKFASYTFLGSFVWSYLLGWIGFKLGQNWTRLHETFRKLDYLIILLLVLAIIWYVRRHMRRVDET